MRKVIEYTRVEIVGDGDPLDLVSFTRLCRLEEDTVAHLVDSGVLEPVGRTRAEWRFSQRAVARGHTAARLMRELELDEASIGLVLDLIEERDSLRRQLAVLRSMIEDED